MISACLRIGDKVTVNIPKENRDWGYNPCENGTIATVKKFAEMPHGRVNNFGRKPGIYKNREQLTLLMPDGSEQHQWTLRCEMVDQEEYKKRVEMWRGNGGMDQDDDKFIRDLPETKFWEGDRVKNSNSQMDYYRDTGQVPDGIWTIKNIGMS